jgi:hypothetical protein
MQNKEKEKENSTATLIYALLATAAGIAVTLFAYL